MFDYRNRDLAAAAAYAPLQLLAPCLAAAAAKSAARPSTHCVVCAYVSVLLLLYSSPSLQLV